MPLSKGLARAKNRIRNVVPKYEYRHGMGLAVNQASRKAISRVVKKARQRGGKLAGKRAYLKAGTHKSLSLFRLFE